MSIYEETTNYMLKVSLFGGCNFVIVTISNGFAFILGKSTLKVGYQNKFINNKVHRLSKPLIKCCVN